MKLLDGKKLAEGILENLRKKIQKENLKLRLAVIQIGENPVSEIFLKQKKRSCEFVGIDFHLYKLKARIKKTKLKREITKIVKNPRNSGVIIQLPLPKNLKTEEILNLIPSKKDVDVLGEESIGKYYHALTNFVKKNLGGQGTSPILPPIVCAVSHLLNTYNIQIKGKNVVLIGAGRLVGLPLALWILKEKGTLTVVNEFTKNISSFTKKADILISGAGKPNLIKGKMIKKGAVIIDCGSTFQEGKILGDVHFPSVSKKASYITRVPGGVGPLTVACLLENLAELNT